MQYFKLLQVLVILIVLSVTSQAYAAPFSDGQKFAKAIVKIDTLRARGTGFFVSDKYLVTNEHVVSGESNVFVTADNGIIYAGAVVRTDKVRDLALVHVPHIGEHAFLRPAIDPLEIGDTIRTIAHTFGLAKSFGEGRVIGLLDNELDMPMEDIVFFSAPVSFGASGSPLLDEDFNVVGVVVAIVRESDFAVAIPLSELLNFLAEDSAE